MRGLPIIFAVVLSFLAGAVLPGRAGETVLTVAGSVENTNRGAFDPFFDGFLKYHDKEFDKAFVFDATALAALPQQSIKVNADTEDWPGVLAMEGPLLKDVLEAAGATGKSVTAYALDGFGLQMDVEKIAAHDWVLAMKVNGEPLGIGGLGPLWLVYDTGDRVAGEDEEKTWVWSVFYIEAE